MPMATSSLPTQTPVTLITGWLGAGKTTLLNRILTESHGQKYAVLINEFGDLGIDDRLIVRREQDLIELSNGCICCTVRGDMIDKLLELRKRKFPFFKRRRFDGILIETTGIAEPAPLLRTFLVEEGVSIYYAVDKIITIADARNLERALEHQSASEQLALADTLIINHCAELSDERIGEAQKNVRAINCDGKLLVAEVPSLRLKDVLEKSEVRFSGTPSVEHVHQHSISTISISSDKALDELRVQLWLDTCVQQLGEDLIRYKGFLNIAGLDYRCLLQGVYDLYKVTADGKWVSPPRNEIVFIGHDLDRDFFQRGFDAALAT
ncbi:MAG: cobalamin biosynthesis protein CobW [Planctomycetes bacterium]|nr:cobalamin biosynthesis protein CobW [Planctomycetota bacterium]